MKLAIFSNAPWTGTGYGTQVAELAPRLKAQGHDVAVVANYGLAGSVLDWNGIPVLPQGYDGWSNDIAGAHIRNFVGDNGYGLTLYDVWTIKGPLWDDTKLAAWVPIDHDPCPEPVAQWFREGKHPRIPIAMSKFGKARLEAEGLPLVHYAPHAINTQLFTPEGTNFRRNLGIPESGVHLTIVNAANKGLPPRKSWGELLMAWVAFAQRHDDAWLYLHTESMGLASGVNIHRLLKATKCPLDRVRIVPQYQYRSGIPTEEMPQVYRMGNVLLSPSRGEGFGIPVIEAQACGVPVITNAWTAQPELTDPGSGWQVEGQPEWDEGMASWFSAPRVDSIVAALEASYATNGDQGRAQSARKFAEQYDSATIFSSHWLPILADLEQRLTPPLNREQRRDKRREALKGGKR